jgi:hypothetical protein
MVRVEAIETGTGRLVWQVNLTGSIQELIALEEQLAMPMLGAAEEAARPGGLMN